MNMYMDDSASLLVVRPQGVMDIRATLELIEALELHELYDEDGFDLLILGFMLPVITYESGSKADLKTGEHVFVTGTHNADESLTATRIAVGKNGLVPPM